MLLLGIHLLEVTKKISAFALPGSVSRVTTGFARRAGSLAPIFLGAATFFLPCGFTQSMQVKALSTGSSAEGALTMFMFALGTLPVLALLSYGSLDLAKSKFRGSFFKAAGLLVILFALFNIYSALVVFGTINPITF
jgi:sulfite exporter TauE/SafE